MHSRHIKHRHVLGTVRTGLDLCWFDVSHYGSMLTDIVAKVIQHFLK